MRARRRAVAPLEADFLLQPLRTLGLLGWADRDANAAACLAQFPDIDWPSVAAKQAETLNGCREESSGVRAQSARETHLSEAARASAQRPRRAVSAVVKTVNTL